MNDSIYEIPVRRIDGTETTLGAYRGKVVLVVNVASACGLTPQYAGLEKLYEERQAAGLVVAGFPANEFGAQEPGSNEEIAEFCSTKFGVKFPMFEKIVVKGQGRSPALSTLDRGPAASTGQTRQRLSCQARRLRHQAGKALGYPVEFREVLGQPRRKGRRSVCAGYDSGRCASQGCGGS